MSSDNLNIRSSGCVVMDIDGTIFSNRAFAEYVKSSGVSWNDDSYITSGYYKYRTPNYLAINICRFITLYTNLDLICVSARPASWYTHTLLELKEYSIYPDRLYLNTDTSVSDVDYKYNTISELLQSGMSVRALIDDRSDILVMVKKEFPFIPTLIYDNISANISLYARGE